MPADGATKRLVGSVATPILSRDDASLGVIRSDCRWKTSGRVLTFFARKTEEEREGDGISM